MSFKSMGPSTGALADRRIYLLADHLDAILAAGEDLCKLRFGRQPGPDAEGGETIHRLNAFVHRARTLEIAAMGRIKQAREHARSLAKGLADIDHRFAPLANLFAAGATVVVDAIDDVCDSQRHAFLDGFDPLVYLRERGLIRDDDGCLAVVEELQIDDEFLLAGQIELGVLLDMCAQFLDVLGEHFELFPEIPAIDSGQPVAEAVRPA